MPLFSEGTNMVERTRQTERIGTLLARCAARGALLLLAGLCCTGCSFWGFGGGGPVPKDTAYRLHGRAPWKLLDAEKASFEHNFSNTAWQSVVQESFGFGGNNAVLRQTISRSWGASPLIGYIPMRSMIHLEKTGTVERMAGRAGTVFPGFPIAVLSWTFWDRWYSLDNGEELATRKYIGLGPGGVIMGYTRTVQPAAIPQLVGNCCHTGPAAFGRYIAAVNATKGDDVRYNSQWGWHIAGGLIAWGRVNYHYVVQVAWIPIPLWRIRE